MLRIDRETQKCHPLIGQWAFSFHNDHTWDCRTLSDGYVNRNYLAAVILSVGMLADTCCTSGMQGPAGGWHLSNASHQDQSIPPSYSALHRD